MSRSFKKTKIFGITFAKSEKEEKRFANRKLRRAVRQKIKIRKEEILPNLREVSNVWAFSKDGKRYFSDIEGKYLRK